MIKLHRRVWLLLLLGRILPQKKKIVILPTFNCEYDEFNERYLAISEVVLNELDIPNPVCQTWEDGTTNPTFGSGYMGPVGKNAPE